MKQVPDRKKLRREYLRKKGTAYLCYYLSKGAFIAVLLFLFFGVGLVSMSAWSGNVNWLIGIVGYAGFCAVVWITVHLAQLALEWRDKAEKATRIPYVPPVKAATLPADEILVRGSEEPPVIQSEALLRAASRSRETAREELLRVTED